MSAMLESLVGETCAVFRLQSGAVDLLPLTEAE